MLINSISKDMDTDEQEAFKTFFASSQVKIPLVTELQNYLLCSKIDSQYLGIEYPQLEEYETSEVTILARIISQDIISRNKAVFDPLKDFIVLNRSFRRSMSNERPDGLKELYLDEDYRSIEILAIYQ